MFAISLWKLIYKFIKVKLKIFLREKKKMKWKRKTDLRRQRVQGGNRGNKNNDDNTAVRKGEYRDKE